MIQVGLSHFQHLQKSPGKQDFQVQSHAVPVTIPRLENHSGANQWVGLTGRIMNFHQRGGTEGQRCRLRDALRDDQKGYKMQFSL